VEGLSISHKHLRISIKAETTVGDFGLMMTVRRLNSWGVLRKVQILKKQYWEGRYLNFVCVSEDTVDMVVGDTAMDYFQPWFSSFLLLTGVQLERDTNSQSSDTV